MPALDDLPLGGTVVTHPELRWQAWQPADVAVLLADVTTPWYVAGGWALDLCRGEQTREHNDLEVAVPAAEFGDVRRALAGYEFEAVGDGRLWPVDSPAFARTFQTWLSEPDPARPGGRVYRLDVFREPAARGHWMCRCDEQIKLPYPRVIRHSPSGIPYLAPELALLFKARHPQLKDEADFAGIVPLLTAQARGWLRRTLGRVHPDHPWIESL